MKQAIVILRHLAEGGSPEFDLDFGLCWRLRKFRGLNLFSIFSQWDEYSGSMEYPIHTSTGTSPERQYVLTKNLWIGEYGEARRRLCGFVANELEERENGTKCV